MADPYIKLIRELWDKIADLYNQFAEQRPVMLVDVQDGSIHAFPVASFAELLDAPSRAHLDEQYARAIDTQQMVLFVRDVENKVFQSYSLQLDARSV